MPITRRYFLLTASAFATGCAIGRRGAEPASTAAIRQPAIGQSWRYSKHDLFTGAITDTQDDRVAAVDHTVVINSTTEGESAVPSGADGGNWLHKYLHHPNAGSTLASEVQDPWGMVLVDPHWRQLQVYERPIPLWPNLLQRGWYSRFTTNYKVSEHGPSLPWEQTMKAEDWETIKVPAGQFRTLRYINSINFTDSDFARTAAVRRETVWFAPEVGRWVARESSGSYYMDDSVVDNEFKESSYRWELLAWT